MAFNKSDVPNSRISTRGYAAKSAGARLEPFKFERRELGPKDILIKIAYCGICHSDIHQVNGDWGDSSYPIVPGHEIIGKVERIGSTVSQFAVGDLIGVGCMVSSCGHCKECKDGEEHYCREVVWTYNSPEGHIGGTTYGGYANNIVVDEDFALKISPKADPAATAPLLCAGITTYSPLKHWKVGQGQKVGIAGLGGLGHVAVKLARSMGAHVVVLTTSSEKIKDAISLGAHEVILSNDLKQMQQNMNSIDFILDTISANHSVDQLLSLLKRDGQMVMVGLPSKPLQVGAFSLVGGRHSLSGSGIGSIKETQEMLDYCAENGITCDIELIGVEGINEAYERVTRADVKYRFVIDMSFL